MNYINKLLYRIHAAEQEDRYAAYGIFEGMLYKKELLDIVEHELKDTEKYYYLWISSSCYYIEQEDNVIYDWEEDITTRKDIILLEHYTHMDKKEILNRIKSS